MTVSQFFPIPMQGSIDVHLGAFDILKAHSHAATIPALACVNRHFSVLLWRKVFGDLFLLIVFHRRSKRVKIFSETFVTKYPYKGDHNTSKRKLMYTYSYIIT